MMNDPRVPRSMGSAHAPPAAVEVEVAGSYGNHTAATTMAAQPDSAPDRSSGPVGLEPISRYPSLTTASGVGERRLVAWSR